MSTVHITWYGHACYLLEAEGYRLGIDPYAPGSIPGYPPLSLEAHQVLVSHGHDDHSYIEAVTLLSRDKNPFAIHTIESFHDDANGTLRGENRIHLIEMGDIRMVHLGDIGEMLDDRRLDAIGRCDLLMVPVGGYYTVDAMGAKRLVDAIDPTVVLPMHYRFDGHGPQVIDTVDTFLDLPWDCPIHRLDRSTIEITGGMERQVVTLISANR